jgi:hypothetical protein
MAAGQERTRTSTRLELRDLNTGHSSQPLRDNAMGIWTRVLRGYRNLSLFLAGMYTGVKCSGVPPERNANTAKRDEGPL